MIRSSRFRRLAAQLVSLFVFFTLISGLVNGQYASFRSRGNELNKATEVRGSKSSTSIARPPTVYRIALRQPATHLYSATDNIEVTIFTDQQGGGLESDIGAQSHNVPKGDSNLSLGRVPTPGVYFTRYRINNESFVNSFLVLPVANNRFTVDIISAPVAAISIAPPQNPVLKKYFLNVTGTRLQSAAGAVAPAWFAQNGQNFLVLSAKGIILTYSGIGFIAIMGQGGIAQELFALSLDFVATVLARVADDLHAAQVLTAAERNSVKQVISTLNGVAQTALADGLFQRIVTVGQSVAEVALGQDDDSKVAAKVVGDSIKKFHVFIQLNKTL